MEDLFSLDTSIIAKILAISKDEIKLVRNLQIWRGEAEAGCWDKHSPTRSQFSVWGLRHAAAGKLIHKYSP